MASLGAERCRMKGEGEGLERRKDQVMKVTVQVKESGHVLKQERRQ